MGARVLSFPYTASEHCNVEIATAAVVLRTTSMAWHSRVNSSRTGTIFNRKLRPIH
jgi:hypothetical protein